MEASKTGSSFSAHSKRRFFMLYSGITGAFNYGVFCQWRAHASPPSVCKQKRNVIPAINSQKHAFWSLSKKRCSDGGLRIPPMRIIMFWLFVLTIATMMESMEKFSCFRTPVQAPHRVIDGGEL
jgi:hypothetical protein